MTKNNKPYASLLFTLVSDKTQACQDKRLFIVLGKQVI